MVSQAEVILRVITLWFLVLSQFFLETVWVPLILFTVLTLGSITENASYTVHANFLLLFEFKLYTILTYPRKKTANIVKFMHMIITV